MSARRVTMPRLHVGQDEIRKHPARFKAVPCGRRWGKSKLAFVLLLSTALERRLPTWWIWPTNVMAREAWFETNGFLQSAEQLERQGFPLTISRVEHAIRIAGGGSVAMRSADRPESLVGAGLGAAVFDECGLHLIRTFEESVRPALADNRGWGLFTGSPKGRQGLLWHAHQLGLDPAAKDWATFPRPTIDSPLFPRDEWADILADHEAGRLSDRYFRQEWLAEFLGDYGSVFEKVAEAATAPIVETRPDGAYVVVGIDWGRMNDATIFSAGNVGRTPPRQIAIERIVGRSYEEQWRRLEEFCERWRPDLIVPERNSMGGPLCERIATRWPTYFGEDGEPGFVMHPGSKRPLIEHYAQMFREGKIEILPDPVQIAEHQAYEAKQLTTGYMQYGASKHGHDDTVVAGALWASQAGQIVDWGCVIA